MAKISIVKCESYNYSLVYEKIKHALSLIGGIKKFIQPGEKILLKPNLLSAHTPEEAVTTHPEIIRVIIKIVKSANAIPMIFDSPSILNVDSVYEKTGIKTIAQEENVEIIHPSEYSLKEFDINSAKIKKLYLSKIVFEVDGIINIPKLKTHALTTLTLGIKNLYGLIPGFIKSEYHKEAHNTKLFNELLSEIYRVVRPKIKLSILDGIIGMEGNGPANGKVRSFNLLAAAEDTVALDTFIFNLLKIKNAPLLKYCKEKNLGETDIKEIEILGDIPEFFNDVLLPKTHIANFIPEVFVNLIKNLVWCKPEIINSKCKLCMECYKICPVKTIKLKEISNKKILYISQENCISCFCCNEVCPNNSIKIKDSFMLSIARKIIEIFKN